MLFQKKQRKKRQPSRLDLKASSIECWMKIFLFKKMTRKESSYTALVWTARRRSTENAYDLFYNIYPNRKLMSAPELFCSFKYRARFFSSFLKRRMCLCTLAPTFYTQCTITHRTINSRRLAAWSHQRRMPCTFTSQQYRLSKGHMSDFSD